MERRKAIKGIALSLGSMVSLPTWASGWNSTTIATTFHPKMGNETLLAELVETIIPTTNSLGAKGLDVHKLIERFGSDAPDGVRLAVVNRIANPEPGCP